MTLDLEVRPRRRGFAVNGDRLNQEMAARGLQGDDLARLAGISEDTVARARNGERVERNSLLKLTDALLRVPVNPTLAGLVGLPVPTPRKKRTAGASTSPAVKEDNGGQSTVDAPARA